MPLLPQLQDKATYVLKGISCPDTVGQIDNAMLDCLHLRVVVSECILGGCDGQPHVWSIPRLWEHGGSKIKVTNKGSIHPCPTSGSSLWSISIRDVQERWNQWWADLIAADVELYPFDGVTEVQTLRECQGGLEEKSEPRFSSVYSEWAEKHEVNYWQVPCQDIFKRWLLIEALMGQVPEVGYTGTRIQHQRNNWEQGNQAGECTCGWRKLHAVKVVWVNGTGE